MYDNQCLYDSTNPDFRNSVLKERLWTEFGEMVSPKMTGEQVIRKWHSLKQGYSREAREKLSGNKKKSWKWFDMLTFLDGEKKARPVHIIRRPVTSSSSVGSVTTASPVRPRETRFSDLLREKTAKANGSVYEPINSNKTQVPGYIFLNTGIQPSPFKQPAIESPDELTYYLLSLKPSLERLKADRDLLEETKMEIQRLIYEKSKLLAQV